jgi:hypothetical protein
MINESVRMDFIPEKPSEVTQIPRSIIDRTR